MSENKNSAVIGLLIAAALLILTAFSSADAWEEAAETADPMSTEQLLLQGTAGELASEDMMTEATMTEEIATEEIPSENTASEDTTEVQAVDSTESVSSGETQESEVETTPTETEETVEETTPTETEETVEGTAPTETEETVEETAPAETEAPQVVDYFADQFVVTVTGKTALNVREEPDADSKWVGKMYEGSGGTILEVGDGWSKIRSGNVTGWVSNKYILTGEEGKAKALEICELVFEVESDALKVRSAPTTEEDNKLRAIYGGETYTVISVQEDGWVQIQYGKEKTGWVAGEYGSLRYDYDYAMTKKEIQDAENAKKKVDVGTTQRESTGASQDEIYLLACLINCESNHYEGQLAVANVVLNRVKSSRFPNSISEVIYAHGQFSPARSGKLDRRLQSGPSASAMQAAQDALNGVNNIGDYMYFRSAKTADLSKYKAYTIVAGNCFYKK